MNILKTLPWEDFDPFWEHLVNPQAFVGFDKDTRAVRANVEYPMRKIMIDAVIYFIHQELKDANETYRMG